jgi:tetratricopeptide (TPR) repeat protein
MTRLIRGVCTLAAVGIAAGVLASCAGGTSRGTAYEEGSLQATDRQGRRVRLTPRSAVLVAFRSWQRKNYGNAIRLANYAIKSHRLEPRGLSLAYLVRGLAYHSTNRFSAARADYTASLTSDPTNHLAYQSRGLVRGIQKDNLGAIEDLNTAIRIRPTFTSHYVRGLMNLRLKRFDQAYSDATTVIAMRPNKYHGYYLRGLVRHFQGQRTLAAADYRHVLRINPAHKGAKAALRIVGRGRPSPRIRPRQDPEDVRLLPVSATSSD